MLTCPMCKNSVASDSRQCPRCQTDLGLLCEFRDRVGEGVERAQSHLRAGELDEAVWTYLEVLEIDPDNPVAHQQVGRVASAVRHFERIAPSRQFIRKKRRQEQRARWIVEAWKIIFCIGLLATVGVVAYYVGYHRGELHATSEQ